MHRQSTRQGLPLCCSHVQSVRQHPRELDPQVLAAKQCIAHALAGWRDRSAQARSVCAARSKRRRIPHGTRAGSCHRAMGPESVILQHCRHSVQHQQRKVRRSHAKGELQATLGPWPVHRAAPLNACHFMCGWRLYKLVLTCVPKMTSRPCSELTQNTDQSQFAWIESRVLPSR